MLHPLPAWGEPSVSIRGGPHYRLAACWLGLLPSKIRFCSGAKDKSVFITGFSLLSA